MKKSLIIAIIAIIILVPFLWYLASPLFIDKTVNEELLINPNNQDEQIQNDEVQEEIVQSLLKYQGEFSSLKEKIDSPKYKNERKNSSSSIGPLT